MEEVRELESILNSVKKMIGIDQDYTVFDVDIITHTNTAFSILHQLGVGPDEGFEVTDNTQTWTDFMGDDPRLNFVKSWVTLKVKMLFDPPQSSALIDSANRLLSELEWRINVSVDPKDQGGE